MPTRVVVELDKLLLLMFAIVSFKRTVKSSRNIFKAGNSSLLFFNMNVRFCLIKVLNKKEREKKIC
jgi:hypothetical protein